MLHYSYILTANIVYKFYEVLFSFKKKKNDGSTTNNFSAADIHIQYINPLGWGSISHHNSIFPPRRKEKIVTQKSHPGQRGRIIKKTKAAGRKGVSQAGRRKNICISTLNIFSVCCGSSVSDTGNHISLFFMSTLFTQPQDKFKAVHGFL